MNRFIVTAMLLLLLTGCSTKNEPALQQKSAPAALTSDNEVSGSSFKSRSPDIVEALWEEKLEQTPHLKALIDKIDALREQAQDSLETFARFEEKNGDYYRIAERKVNDMTDSFLKHRLTEKLAYSKKAYEQKIAMLAALKQQLEQKQGKAENEAAFLKIAATLDMLQQYQQAQLPGTGPLSGVNKEYDQLVQQLGDMKKQYD